MRKHDPFPTLTEAFADASVDVVAPGLANRRAVGDADGMGPRPRADVLRLQEAALGHALAQVLGLSVRREPRVVERSRLGGTRGLRCDVSPLESCEPDHMCVSRETAVTLRGEPSRRDDHPEVGPLTL